MICKVFLLDEMNAKLLHLIFSGVCIEAGAVQRAPMAMYCSHVHFSGIFGTRHFLVRYFCQVLRGRHYLLQVSRTSSVLHKHIDLSHLDYR